MRRPQVDWVVVVWVFVVGAVGFGAGLCLGVFSLGAAGIPAPLITTSPFQVPVSPSPSPSPSLVDTGSTG